MNFRHEIKHEINNSDMITIRHRLSAVAYHDPHTIDGKYFIRSLYFDNLADKALMEKINGLSRREKFRIRYYNGDTSVIHLEKKSKTDRLGTKFSAPLTAQQAQSIVDYTREPFIYPAGNVRVTLDYNIRSGMRCTDFLRPDCVTVPVSDSIILEVKWDGFLPDIIRDAVALSDRNEGAFSKYAACRIYG